MLSRDSRKSGPARAHLLDPSSRDEFLPDRILVDLLELSGAETVLDDGAGAGRTRLSHGHVVAVEEGPEMMERLRSRTAGRYYVEVLAIAENRVPPGRERGLDPRRRPAARDSRRERADRDAPLLKPGDALLVVDWDRARPREPGPPARHRYSANAAQQELATAGFQTERVDTSLPYHLASASDRQPSAQTERKDMPMLFNRSRSSQSLSPTEVAARTDVQIVDVRSRREWQTGHVPRAKHIPLDHLPSRLGELSRSQPVAFICRSGARSKMATKLAARAGIEAINIAGGMKEWQRAGLPSSSR